MLTQNEEKSLYILGYLYFRMGFHDKAERILKALLVMKENISETDRSDNNFADVDCMEEKTSDERNVFALLAAVSIHHKNGAAALEYLDNIFDGSLFVGKESIFYLLKSQALFLEERHDEARTMLDQYLLCRGKK